MFDNRLHCCTFNREGRGSNIIDICRNIIILFTEHKDNEEVVNDLLLTLSALVVRNEFCKKVEDAGGLRFLLQALEQYSTNEVCVCTCKHIHICMFTKLCIECL